MIEDINSRRCRGVSSGRCAPLFSRGCGALSVTIRQDELRCLTGVSLVGPDVRDARAGVLVENVGERGSALRVRGRGVHGEEASSRADEDVAFDAVDLLRTIEPAGPPDRCALRG